MPNKKLGFIVAVCSSCYLLEKMADSNVAKNVAVTLVCGACTFYGGKMTFDAGKKVVDGLAPPVAQAARVVRQRLMPPGPTPGL